MDETTSGFLLACGFEVSAATAGAMARAAVHVHLDRGEFLFHQGDPAGTLYILRQGRVEVIATSADGQELVFRTMEPGALIGELTLFDDVARTASIRAVADSELIQLSRQTIIDIAEEHPDLGIALARIATRRLRLLSTHLERTAFDPLDDRLRALLATLVQTDADGIASVATTQASLGGRLGVSREAVNRHLQRWSASGHISLGRGKIVIHNAGFFG